MNNTEEKEPLVSIIVITYNSSKYVLETLESAKAQTYKNIELIITDDASQDDTPEVCKKWVVQNKFFFKRVELISSRSNLGVPENCNRGFWASKGKWIKFIAGDDILEVGCIEKNLDYIKENNLAQCVHSRVKIYNNDFKREKLIEISNNKFLNNNKLTAVDQYNILQYGCFIMAPSVFIRRDLLIELNGFDNGFGIEDWPLWLRITAMGRVISFLEDTTVCYRRHSNSLYNKAHKKALFTDFYKYEEQIHKKLVYPKCKWSVKKIIQYKYLVKKLFVWSGLNKKNAVVSLIFKILLYPYSCHLAIEHKRILSRY